MIGESLPYPPLIPNFDNVEFVPARLRRQSMSVRGHCERCSDSMPRSPQIHHPLTNGCARKYPINRVTTN